jgi:crossover junction endodeoxyribonuclease RuvC
MGRIKKEYFVGIDLGTLTGFAVYCRCGSRVHFVKTAQMKYSETRFSGGGVRFLHFKKDLESILNEFRPVFVGFEKVEFRHRGAMAAAAYNGFLSVLTVVLEEYKIPYDGYAPGTCKKAMTGRGNSSKEAVRREVCVRYGIDEISEDEADACAAALAAANDLGKMIWEDDASIQ